MELRKYCAVVVAGASLWLSHPAHAETAYSVRSGDTLAKIARSYGLTVEQILKANPSLSEASAIKVGSVLILPDTDGRADDNRVAMVTPKEGGDEAILAAGVSHDPPKASPVRIDDGRNESADEGNEDEFVLDRSGDYHRRPAMASRRGRMLNSLTRTAHRFMGTPYSFGGTSERGIDCSGFVMRVFLLNGIKLPRTADVQFNVGAPVPRGSEAAGDLVFFETYCAGPSHVGIYLGAGNFIHASSSKGVTISNLKDQYYRGRYLGARRVF